MRILMACAAFPPFIDGGGPISALLIAKLLIGAGHDVLVVNVADEEKREVFDGVPVQRLKSFNVYWNYRVPRPAWKKLVWHGLENFNPRAFLAMRRQIKAFKPDIVLTDSIENINVASWGAAKSLGVPTCHILRSTFLLCWKASMMRGGHNCAGICGTCRTSSVGKKWMSRFVDGVIGETDFIVDRHTREGYFPHAARRTIPGVIPALAASEPRPAPAGRPLRVGYIGVHTAPKGLTVLAEAARRFQPSEAVEFVIAGSGSGPYAENVPERFAGTRTRFIGWTDPAAFFPQVDVIVVPSLLQEPFGRVAIEAFSHAVPVIGSLRGGIGETIDNGVNGCTVPAGDADAIEAAIRRLMDSPEETARLSAGALASARRYLPARIGAAYSGFLDEVRHSGDAPARLGLQDIMR